MTDLPPPIAAARREVPVRVLMLPDWRRDNPYQEMLAQGLRDQGCEVDFANYRLVWFGLSRLCSRTARPTVLHLHWEHPLLDWVLWSRNPVTRVLKTMALWLDLQLLYVIGIRVVWTIHNRVSHESKEPKEEIRLRAVLARGVRRIIVHSRSAVAMVREDLGTRSIPEHKLAVIPHGNYDGQYPPVPAEQFSLPAEWHAEPEVALTILFFGALRRYKGVTSLLRAFERTRNKSLRLLIVGSGADEQTRGELQSAAARDSRIRYEIRFVATHEVSAVYGRADVVVVPFERTLTSGSVVLAMTMGRAVILPRTAMVLDIPGPEGALYYDGTEELVALLDNLDKDSLKRRGLFNRALAETLAWPALAQQTLHHYQS